MTIRAYKIHWTCEVDTQYVWNCSNISICLVWTGDEKVSLEGILLVFFFYLILKASWTSPTSQLSLLIKLVLVNSGHNNFPCRQTPPWSLHNASTLYDVETFQDQTPIFPTPNTYEYSHRSYLSHNSNQTIVRSLQQSRSNQHFLLLVHGPKFYLVVLGGGERQRWKQEQWNFGQVKPLMVEFC